MLLYESETHAILGACFEVYNELGCGFLEAVYQEALGIEFKERDIMAFSEVALGIRYKGRLLDQQYRADFICHGKIILELKAVSTLLDEYRAQLHNYLKVTGYRVGLLLNFGHFPKLEYERIVK